MESQLSNETLQTLHTDLLAHKLPTAQQALEIITRATASTTKAANVLEITGTVTVIGNICGQFHDYVNVLKEAGSPSDSNHLLFLGDLVNRGRESTEVLLSVAILKVLHDKHVSILRGKMECDELSATYGFKEEGTKKLGADFYNASVAFFNSLPLAAVVNKTIFAVHGGIGPDTKTVDSINALSRHGSVPHTGPITDLIWSDPSEQDDEFGANKRGAGKIYGLKAVDAFLTANKFNHIVRSNQLVDEGHKFVHDLKILTVWSVPMYCYQCTNKASIVKFFEKDAPKFTEIKVSEETVKRTEAAKKHAEQGHLSNECLHSIHSDLLLGKLPTAQAGAQILKRAAAIVTNEATLLKVNGPVTVIGNICGQWHDYLEVLKNAGSPSHKNHFVFLGDLVNRGTESTEVLLSVAILKLLHSEYVHILRGKMECDDLCALYGFKEEAHKKMDDVFYNNAVAFFNGLPLAAVLNNHIFAVHGGFGPENTSLCQIAALNKNQNVPHKGPITDLIWSDPCEDAGEFEDNKRGAGKIYGKKAVENFLKATNMLAIVRSNQLVDEGFKYLHDDKVLTVFSAPNYCYQYANPGTIVQISERLEKKVITFKASCVTVKRTEEAKKKAEQKQ